MLPYRSQTCMRPIWIFAMNLCVVSAVYGAEFYVSAIGKDGNPGNKERSFATLEAARDAIRALPATAKAKGVTVWVQEGSYSLDSTFTLDTRDSGSEEGRIVYRAVKDGEVVFNGGVQLKGSDWKPVTNPAVLKRLPESARGKVMQTDLAAYGFKSFDPMPVTGMAAGALYNFNIVPRSPAAYELFCNDQALQLARWPNKDYTTTGKIINPGAAPRFWQDDIGPSHPEYVPPERRDPKNVPVFQYRDQRHANWVNAEDPWILIWNNFYADIAVPVRKIDPASGTLTLEYPLGYGLAERYDRTDKMYYIFNLLEEIDQPGEWYLDRSTGYLYCWPPVPIEDAKYILTRTAHILFGFKDVSHVVLRGFVVDGGRAPEVVRVQGGESVHIDGCTFKNLAGKAVTVTGGRKHTVANCHIFNTGSGGLHLEGGERKTLTPADHLAENNHIHTYARIQKSYSDAITLKGVGNVARHNRIHDAEHCAMSWKGNDHVIEYNEIFNVVRTGTDMGALYTGRDVTCLGIVIRYNYFHHIGNNNSRYGSQAIFLDDSTQGHHIYGNVFFKAGSNAAVKYNGGVRNIMENNIIIGQPPGAALVIQKSHYPAGIRSNKTHMDLLNSIDPTSDPWRTRWPWLTTVTEDKVPTSSNMTTNNLIISTSLGAGGSTAENNFVTNGDPGFVNMKSEDFTLKDDSIVFTKLPGFKPIPFGKMGLRSNVTDKVDTK
jgi:hypothetical protein